MKRTWFTFPGTVCMLGVLAVSGLVSQYANAQTGDFGALNRLNNSALNNAALNDLFGFYAFQFTGTLFLPAPFNSVNGPMYRNGVVVFEGNGKFTVTSLVSNYNGSVSNDLFSGTYVSRNDGTFTITIVNLPIPAIPSGIPNVFTFDGVLADKGRIAKVVLSAISVGGHPQANIGSVVTAEFIRQ